MFAAIFEKKKKKKHKMTICESEKIFFTFLHFRQSEQILRLFSQISIFEDHNNTELRKLLDDDKPISA
jgi:hypothetical protein